MKSVATAESSINSSRIPTISANHTLHKSTRSDIALKEAPKHESKKLSLNMTVLQSNRLKPPQPTGFNSKRVSLMPSPKGSNELFSIKEPLKTAKSTVKKFDLKQVTSSNASPSICRIRWEEIKTPLSSSEVIKRFNDALPKWEQEEVKNYSEVYYIGKNFKPKEPEFDDENGDYKVLIKDHIAFRYEIIALIGKGSFGQVLEVYDHKEKRSIALKIIKNKSKFNQQAKIEVEILELIKDFDLNRESNIIEIQDKFVFRKHMVRYI